MTASVFAPLRIGSVALPNRIAPAPVKTAFGPVNGLATDRHTAFYRRRAEGGAGLIIVEPLCVTPAEKEHPNSFVVAVGVRPLPQLKGELEERGLSVRVIGDAFQPGQAVDAVLAGYESVAVIGGASAESPPRGTEDPR